MATEEVRIKSQLDAWCETLLEDGTVVRVKYSLAAVYKEAGQFDLEGNPLYQFRGAPTVVIVHVDEANKRRLN